MKTFVASVLLLAAVFALYTQSAGAQDVATLTAQVRMMKHVAVSRASLMADVEY
jgi:hypothetical protein